MLIKCLCRGHTDRVSFACDKMAEKLIFEELNISIEEELEIILI